MPAKLVSYTVPCVEGIKDLKEFVAYVARVSNPANQNNVLTSTKLLDYLRTHHHWSPFEMAHVVVEIETTRDIARQILRHRSFSFQEFSQRYADVRAMSNDCVIREARLQDHKNRQNSIDIDDSEETEALRLNWEARQQAVWNAALDAYDWAIKQGIAKEVARAVLPEGLTPSRLYMAGSLRSWIHYLELRMDPSTQKEHRLIASEIANALLPVFEV